MNALPIKCIFVGVKNRGSYIIDLCTSQKDKFEVEALVDKTTGIAQSEADRRNWQKIPCFSSLQQAINETEADACIITSPACFHSMQMRTALNAGLHVFVAKPMTYDLKEAIYLVELAEKKNLCIVVDQQQQFSLTERTIAEWIRTGRFGKLGFVDFSIHRYRPQMLSFTSENPFIWEQGAHSFNSLAAILDRPAKSVIAHQMKPSWSVYNGPTVTMGVIEFEDSVPCHYMGTFDSIAFNIEIRFDMEQAAVRAVAENSWNKRLEVALPGKLFEPAGIEDNQDSRPLENHTLDAFIRGCLNGSRVSTDGRDNLRTLSIIDAFIRSAETNEKTEVLKV